MFWLVGAAVVAGAIGAWICVTTSAEPALLKRYGVTLFGIEVALAVFSVNLSLVIFQLSPYRHLVSGLSGRHLALAAGVLIVSLVPLAASNSGPEAVGRAAIALSPLTAFGGFLVGALAQREARPAGLLRRASSNRMQDAFLAISESFGRQEHDRRQEEIRNATGGPPTHEIGHRNPLPPTSVDPFDICIAVIATGVRSDDVVAVDAALERLLTLGVALHEKASQRGNEVRWTIENHWPRVLNRAHHAVAGESAGEAAGRMVLQIGQFLRSQQLAGNAVNEISMHALAAGRRVASALLAGDRSGEAVSFLVDLRHIVTRELENEPGLEAEYSLAGYPASVGALGKSAIEVENLHVLYTCLDTLAWLGCDAVRTGNDEVARSCLQSLAQLGREARARNLECFWSHCALTPTDHANERLSWVASWLPKFPEKGRDHLAGSVAKAFSRLVGVEYFVSVESVEPPEIRIERDEDKAYVESYASDGQLRILDYSDPQMLKELRLR